MKGQQIFSIFSELKKKGHVEDIDSQMAQKEWISKIWRISLKHHI